MSFTAFFSDTLVLESSRVKLRLLSADDLPDLAALSERKEIWTYFTKDLGQRESLKRWLSEALEEKQSEKRFPFTIIDKATSKLCGSTSLGSISFFDQRIEIGWS
jgi:N-acetyltransferase